MVVNFFIYCEKVFTTENWLKIFNKFNIFNPKCFENVYSEYPYSEHLLQESFKKLEKNRPAAFWMIFPTSVEPVNAT